MRQGQGSLGRGAPPPNQHGTPFASSCACSDQFAVTSPVFKARQDLPDSGGSRGGRGRRGSPRGKAAVEWEEEEEEAPGA